MAIKKSGKAKDEGIKYEVLEKCGVIAERNGDYNLELRYVAWNGGEAKYDIRPWKQKDDGTETCGKGITLTGEELESLGELIVKLASND